jgi:hypothetical protein
LLSLSPVSVSSSASTWWKKVAFISGEGLGRRASRDDVVDHQHCSPSRRQRAFHDVRRLCSVDLIPSVSKRRVKAGTVSSAARIPLSIRN